MIANRGMYNLSHNVCPKCNKQLLFVVRGPGRIWYLCDSYDWEELRTELMDGDTYEPLGECS
jgi:ssDNA-binding Zn-finger/Zn-ribbon topoisomerase 1